LNDIFDENRNYSAFVTQWGWQFETLFTTSSEISGVVEFVPLIGGVEQNIFLPSFNLLVGIRSNEGWDIGMGPALTLAGSGIVVTTGRNFQSGGINFPVNLAANFGEGGVRISLLAGFNAIRYAE
jgi:hypothetical protein